MLPSLELTTPTPGDGAAAAERDTDTHTPPHRDGVADKEAQAGVGARELTFILGYQYVGINENVSVAFSLLFFLITAFVSMFGGFFRLDSKGQ